MKTCQQVIDDLAVMLANFEGREYSGPIEAETMFYGDLGFVSIDAVVLIEKLQAHYGQELPFPKFLSEAAKRGAEDISVGELADFIAEHLD